MKTDGDKRDVMKSVGSAAENRPAHKNRIRGILAALLAGMLLFSGCTGAAEETAEASAESEASLEEEETQETSASTEEKVDPEEEAESESDEEAESTSEEEEKVHPYAWLGLQDMPTCRYLDILSSGHYIQVYDDYEMLDKIEEIEAVDGIDSVKINEKTRTYAIDGQIKRVANSTFIITPYNVGVVGDILDELENSGVYF